MNKNLHNNDDLFRKAYQSYEDEPSPEVWEKINAQLDKRDALYFRSRMTMWKRIAAMLCVLLGAFIAYELFFAGNRSSNPEHNDLAEDKSALLQQETGAAKKQQDSFARLHDSISMTGSVHTGLTANKKTGGYAYKKTSGINYKKSFYALPGKSVAYAHVESIAKSEPGDNQRPQGFYEADSLDGSSFSSNKINADEKQPAVVFGQHNSDTSFNKSNTIAGKRSAPSKQVFSNYWSFTPYVSVDFIGQRLDNDGSFPEPVQPAVLEQREHHEPSFSAGFFAGYHFTKKLSFKTGLLYANSSTAIAPQTLHAASDNKGYELITTAGYVYLDKVFGQTAVSGDSVAATNTEHHIASFNIPLMAAYTINPQSRLTVTPGAGLYTHIILGSKIETEIKKDGNRQTVSLTNFKGQRPAYFSFAADAAIGYKLNKKLSLAVIPSFNYAITSITSKNAVKTYPYTFRIGAGITWNLED